MDIKLSFPKIARWSEKRTVDFIREYLKHPCLYKANSESFRNKGKRYVAFQQISKCMDIPGFGPREVQTKIRSLRSTFSQECRKIRDSNGSYVSNLRWFPILFKALSSDIGAIKKSINRNYCVVETVSLPGTPQEENDSDKNMDSEVTTEFDRKEDHLDDNEDDDEDDDDFDTEVHLEEEHLDDNVDSDVDTKVNILNDTNQEVSTDTNTRQKRRKRPYKKVLQETRQYYSHRADNPTTEQIENEFDIFGKSIAAQLKNMPLKMAIKAEMNIQNYLSNMRLKALQPTLSESFQSSQSN